jgi:hypothetical protein
MVITYCDVCGILMRADHGQSIQDVCDACTSGSRPKINRQSRDSGHIPYATRPSSGQILREIRSNVRNR